MCLRDWFVLSLPRAQAKPLQFGLVAEELR
jgi:hypothetical protein